MGTGNYMDKVSNPTADDILVTDANGQAQDSGVAIADIDNIFMAYTNITTYAELWQAYRDEKYIIVDNCPTGGLEFENNTAYIVVFSNWNKTAYSVTSSNVWTVESRTP